MKAAQTAAGSYRPMLASGDHTHSCNGHAMRSIYSHRPRILRRFRVCSARVCLAPTTFYPMRLLSQLYPHSMLPLPDGVLGKCSAREGARSSNSLQRRRQRLWLSSILNSECKRTCWPISTSFACLRTFRWLSFRSASRETASAGTDAGTLTACSQDFSAMPECARSGTRSLGLRRSRTRRDVGRTL